MMRGQPALGVNGRHATRTGRSNCLTIFVVLHVASSKYTLSDEQKAAIRAMTPTQEEEKQAEETVDFLTATANDDQPF